MESIYDSKKDLDETQRGAFSETADEVLKEVIETVKYEVEFKKEEISEEGTKTILAGG